MTVRRHRRYSTEFKIQLVQAYLDGEGSVREDRYTAWGPPLVAGDLD